LLSKHYGEIDVAIMAKLSNTHIAVQTKKYALSNHED